MTIIKQGVKTQDVKSEIRQLRQTVRKLAASKATARRFLISTGMYTPTGRLKPEYR